MALYLEQAMVLQLTRIALRPRPDLGGARIGLSLKRNCSTQAFTTRKRELFPETTKLRRSSEGKQNPYKSTEDGHEKPTSMSPKRASRSSTLKSDFKELKTSTRGRKNESYDDFEENLFPKRASSKEKSKYESFQEFDRSLFQKRAAQRDSQEDEPRNERKPFMSRPKRTSSQDLTTRVSRLQRPAPRQKLSVAEERPAPEFCPFSETAGFGSLKLSKPVVKRLKEIGIASPTDVQVSAIPVLLEGHDAAMQSYTGSGKTLAYLLPILSRIGPLAEPQAAVQKNSIDAVIVAPSRELAMQIVRETEKLLGEENRKLVQQLIGGANMKRQAEALKKNKPLIVVGTPGRISEFSRAGKLHTHSCKFLVLDEADQILSMKYRNDMKRILEHVGVRRSLEPDNVPQAADERQTILVSATMPRAVLRAAQEWGHKPLLLTAKSAESVPEHLKDTGEGREEGKAGEKQAADIKGAKESLPPNLRHLYVTAAPRHRVSTLKKCIVSMKAQTVLVFMNFTQRLKDTMFKLQAGGIDAACLHGEKGKLGRTNTLSAFKRQKLHVLVVSEIGARGLDVPECDLVVNLELPTDATHYAHRAGRTGRIGKAGTVLSICEDTDKFVLDKFSKQLGITIEKCEVSFGVVSLDKDVEASQAVVH